VKSVVALGVARLTGVNRVKHDVNVASMLLAGILSEGQGPMLSADNLFNVTFSIKPRSH